MVAGFAGQFLGAVIGVWGCRDLLGRAWNGLVARRMAAIGVPFAVIGAASGAAPSIDRFFLTHFHGLAEAGLYGVGQKIATLQALALGGFQAAWGPFAVSLARSPDKPAVFGRVFLLVCGGAAYGTLMLLSLAPTIARVAAGPQYVVAAEFVVPLALSVGLGAVFFVVSIGAFLEERTGFFVYAYAAGVAATLLANAGLAAVGAPSVGIAWADCLGQAVSVTLMAVLAQRVHPLPYPFRHGVAVLVIAVATGVVAGFRPPAWSGGQTALACLLLTAIVVAWVWFGVLDSAERHGLRLRVVRR
jgi:O-antigen/teichoic acid export membrane protein